MTAYPRLVVCVLLGTLQVAVYVVIVFLGLILFLLSSFNEKIDPGV